MTDLSTVPIADLLAAVSQRLEKASPSELRELLPEFGGLIERTERKPGVTLESLPLRHVSPRLLVLALNHWISEQMAKDTPAGSIWVSLFNPGGNPLTTVVETVAAMSWFHSAERLGNTLGRPPHGTNGLCHFEGSTRARLLAIAIGRLAVLAPSLTGTPQDGQLTDAHELMWWYQMGRGLVATINYSSELEHVNINPEDAERTFIEARAALQKWRERPGLHGWQSAPDPYALPFIEDLFEDLRARISRGTTDPIPPR